jgi:hypothetical protein
MSQVSEWANVLNGVTARAKIPNGIILHFPARAEVAAQLADLMVREHDCCPFFAFSLDLDRGDLALSVSAPPLAQDMLTAVFGDPATTVRPAI